MIIIINDIFNTYSSGYTARYGWQQNFCEDFFAFGYISSYKDTADILIDQLAPDLYIFPIMFCYRQYMELILKNICYRNMIENMYKAFINRVSHNIAGIWNEAKKYLSNFSKKDLDIIEECVKMFNDIDPDSFTFRYEMDKKLNKNIQQDYLTINFEILKKYIDKVDDILRITYDRIQ